MWDDGRVSRPARLIALLIVLVFRIEQHLAVAAAFEHEPDHIVRRIVAVLAKIAHELMKAADTERRLAADRRDFADVSAGRQK